MHTTILNQTGVSISAIGIGGMRWSIQDRPPEAQSIAVVHAALDAGVTFFDTADSYCLNETDKHHNERLIAKALGSYAGDVSHVHVATKGGLIRPGGRWEVDNCPDRLRETIRESYAALGGQAPIFLWQLHAPDTRYAMRDTFAPIRAAVAAGLIQHVGVSNFSVPHIDAAREFVEIISVQNEYSLWHRAPEEDGVLEYCEKEGLTFLPYRPLGGKERIPALQRHPIVGELARTKRCSPVQLALAWLRAKSPCVVPIPGPTRVESVHECVGAAEMTLTTHDVARLDQVQ